MWLSQGWVPVNAISTGFCGFRCCADDGNFARYEWRDVNAEARIAYALSLLAPGVLRALGRSEVGNRCCGCWPGRLDDASPGGAAAPAPATMCARVLCAGPAAAG
jgi:hypothetical protein